MNQKITNRQNLEKREPLIFRTPLIVSLSLTRECKIRYQLYKTNGHATDLVCEV